MNRNPGFRFTTSTVTVGILIAVIVALAAPAPADAAGCLGCKYTLFCVGGATCWIIEECKEDALVVYNICAVDQFGICRGFGDPCFSVDADPANLGPLGPVEGSMAESCRVAETPAARSEVTAGS